jgi:hypothetical protein
MHETDAMQFIEPVLLGFLSRQFSYQEGEEPCRYEPHLDKIHAFIQDKEPLWVKEKSLQIIANIEAAEDQIQTGMYIPTTPEAFLNTLLDKVRKRLEDLTVHFRIENIKGKMNFPVSFPSFPRKK